MTFDPYAWGRGVSERPRDWPSAVLALVTERQGGRFCVDCRRLRLVTPGDVPLEVDHLQPLAKGGDNHHLNLRWACRSHNRGRRDRPVRHDPALPRWHLTARRRDHR